MSTGPYVLGAIAAIAGVKALFRPRRAVVKEGAISACPGQNRYRICDSTIAIDASAGTPAYATAQGRVVAVGSHFLHIASRQEPVVLMYDGVAPTVEEGQYVGRGERVGDSMGRVYFGVTELLPDGTAVRVDPASWLAIEVPTEAGRPCDLHEPDRGAFALLPVTVSVER